MSVSSPEGAEITHCPRPGGWSWACNTAISVKRSATDLARSSNRRAATSRRAAAHHPDGREDEERGEREEPTAFYPLEPPELAGRLVGRQLRVAVLHEVLHGVKVGRSCGAWLPQFRRHRANVDPSERLIHRVQAHRVATPEPTLVDHPGLDGNGGVG